ncbi:cell wall protein DAN4 [Cynoglossus semilaevis]|nr:cell wall protein DAN4-like [Cynoglossus semilaevis]
MMKTMRMETKVWTVLFALLLLLTCGSADHDNNHAAASKSAPGPEMSTEAPAAVSVSTPSLEPTRLPAPALNASGVNTSSSGNMKLTSNTTADVETTSLSLETKEHNDTNTPTVPVLSVTDSTIPVEGTSHPGNVPNASHTTTTTTTITHSLTTLNTITTTTTTTTPSHTASHTHVETTTVSTGSSLPPLAPDSITTPHQPSHTGTTSIISAPRSLITTAAATSTRSTSSASTTISEKPTSKQVPLEEQERTSSGPWSSPVPQAKAHVDTPSQLNVGGDMSSTHESPTLDPLLAGLVIAFIVTAVIITLLLFLKLRRRDNRPEFRRLQDLPMDDMMEDTPLSMYSY